MERKKIGSGSALTLKVGSGSFLSVPDPTVVSDVGSGTPISQRSDPGEIQPEPQG